jgi:muramoyltetrapeptide carboxypeptidase
LNIPVLAYYPSGHCVPNLTLPLGTHVRLDTDLLGFVPTTSPF